MHGITNLAIGFGLMASAVTNVMALKVNFRRYSQPDCDTNFHIAKDTHLDSPHCKTFDHHEPPYESFVAVPEDDVNDITNKFCQIVAYEQADCKGQGATMGDMQVAANTCGNPLAAAGFGGRSVKVVCNKRAESIQTLTPTKSSTAIVQIVQSTVTVAPSSTMALTTVTMPPNSTMTMTTTMQTTTITLVPQKASTCVCDM
ncbi:hypothetical protein LTR08_006663 [Meristemomyces frigidus]|nr:hypothetical protein LTR08_006663 [Meristemomyces frigidus]